MDTSILQNTAHWLMLEKCKEAGINTGGSHVAKAKGVRRARTYWLIRDETGRPFMQVMLTRNEAPRFTY